MFIVKRMKKLSIIAICALISVALHLYLSNRSYSLSSDKAEKSALCHINSYLDCDRVLSSPYSHVAYLPLSNYGFALNFIIVFLSLLLMINGKKQLMWPALGFFSILSAIGSFTMLSISLFVLPFLCPLCVVLYILSFVILFCAFFRTSLLNQTGRRPTGVGRVSPASMVAIFKVFSTSGVDKKQEVSNKASIKLALFGSQLRGWILGLCLSFVGLSFLVHLLFRQVYDIKSVQKTVKFQVMDWLSAPTKEPMDQAPLLVSGVKKAEALITITEFADFLCFYCQKAHYSLKVLSGLSIRREYFSSPLDQCQGQSLSCLLLRAVFCGTRQNKGWELSDLIFEHQALFISLRNQKDKALKKLKTLSQNLVNQEAWEQCLNSPLAFEIQEQQIKASQKRGIKSTPSVFVNNKKISHRYLTKTVQAIYQKQKGK